MQISGRVSREIILGKATLRSAFAPALVIAALFGAMLWHQHESLDVVNRRDSAAQLRLVGTLLGNAFDQAGRFSLSLAESFARNAEIRAALAEADRGRLQMLSREPYEFLSRQAGVQIFGYHTKDLRYLLRMHRPETHGDDISAFRAMIVAANRLRRAQTGVEIGIAGIGIRGVALVEKERDLLGTMEVGLDIRPIIEAVKTSTNAEIAVVAMPSLAGVALDPKLPAIGDFTLMASTNDALFSTYLRAYPGKPVRDVEIAARYLDGQSYGVMVQPLVDFSGKLVGLTLVLKAEPSAGARRLSTELWVLALVGGILAYIAFAVLARARRETA